VFYEFKLVGIRTKRAVGTWEPCCSKTEESKKPGAEVNHPRNVRIHTDFWPAFRLTK